MVPIPPVDPEVRRSEQFALRRERQIQIIIKWREWSVGSLSL